VLPKYLRQHAKVWHKARATTRFAVAQAAVPRHELSCALAVCGLTYRTVRNGQVANQPIDVAFGVTIGGERGILRLPAGDGWIY
jgi:hypothetical protein